MRHWPEFTKRVGISEPTLSEVVVAISAIPYGRPTDLSAEGVISEWRGTCSTKHLLLLEVLGQKWENLKPALVHRVYNLNKSDALEFWGIEVASFIPDEGLVDVHTFMTATISGRSIAIDATFPVDDWDGRTSMPVWARAGRDFAAGSSPLARKAELVAHWCDPSIREPFIAALSAAPL
jgi:hypothetical protein